jgi:excisionase family DNA binding protein
MQPPHQRQSSDPAAAARPPHAPTMTAAEASQVLNVHPNTLVNWVRRGRISGYRKDGQWRYLRTEILQEVARTKHHRRGGRPEA